MIEKQKNKGIPVRAKRMLGIGIVIGVLITAAILVISNMLFNQISIADAGLSSTIWLDAPLSNGNVVIQDVAIAPDTSKIAILYTTDDRSQVVIHQLDIETGIPTRQMDVIDVDGGIYRDVEWSSKSQRILLAADQSDGIGTVRSIGMDSSEWRFPGHFMAVAHENGLLAISEGSTIAFYDSDNGQVTSRMDVQPPTTRLALSPDAQWLTYIIEHENDEMGYEYVVTTTPHSQDLDTIPQQTRRVWKHHHTDVISAPQGDRILLPTQENWLVFHNIELAGATTARAFEEDTIRRVDVAAYRLAIALNEKVQLAQYTQREGWTTLQWVDDKELNIAGVDHLAFTPDARYLYTIDENQMIAIWDVATATQLHHWTFLE